MRFPASSTRARCLAALAAGSCLLRGAIVRGQLNYEAPRVYDSNSVEGVSALAVADFNRDGLLDVGLTGHYIEGTYIPFIILGDRRSGFREGGHIFTGHNDAIGRRIA